MATKTVVCPECGAAAAPGRYACADCGALLASVAVIGRSLATIDGGDSDQVLPALAPTRVGPESQAAATPDGVGATLDTVPVEPGEPAEPTEPMRGFEARAVEPTLAFDEDAPLGSATAIHVVGDVLDDVAPIPDDGRDIADAGSLVDDPGGAAVTLPDGAHPEAAAPAWPPVGDRGVVARPEPRTPAGAYLPPSAVLPPLDAAPPAIRVPTATGAAALDGSAAATSWASRSSAALDEALDGIELTGDGARRAVAIGAAIAALGMLLPWVNGLAAAGPFAGYLDRWGLAGPGMWLVLVALIAIAAVASSAGRPATWPVGLPAVALAALLLGLLWPYLLGGFGRSFGIWVVLVGAIVLAVGGVLDGRGRHGHAASGVPSDVGGR